MGGKGREPPRRLLLLVLKVILLQTQIFANLPPSCVVAAVEFSNPPFGYPWRQRRKLATTTQLVASRGSPSCCPKHIPIESGPVLGIFGALRRIDSMQV